MALKRPRLSSIRLRHDQTEAIANEDQSLKNMAGRPRHGDCLLTQPLFVFFLEHIQMADESFGLPPALAFGTVHLRTTRLNVRLNMV